MLLVIDEAFEARVVQMSNDGSQIDLGPDHYARWNAVGALVKMLTAGRPMPKPADEKKRAGTMTPAEAERRIGEQR